MKKVNPKHQYIFCIDSDGCVMDTMTLKHQSFFGPLVLKYFKIKNPKQFLKYWDKLNLFSKTRGINRFEGLITALKKFDCQGIDHLENWVKNTDELSNDSLKKEIERFDTQDLKQALDWSIKVNKEISKNSNKFMPFSEAGKVIPQLSQIADVAIVSSANKNAVVSEWKRNNLLKNVDIVFGQEDGKKVDCLELLTQYYDTKKILMIGDAISDYNSANKAGVYFYPILVNHENRSWNLLKKVSFDFVKEKYNQNLYYRKFIENFENLS